MNNLIIKHIIKKISTVKKDESGISSMISFILVVFPLIVIIFAIFEIAYMGSTIISMNRGLMDALVKTSTSQLPMSDTERWENNLATYLLSQGTSRTQFTPSSESLKIVQTLPDDEGVDSKYVYAKITAVLNKSLSDGKAPSYIIVDDITDAAEPPMIKIEIKYRYHFISPYLSYFLSPVENISSIVINSGMETINEHPNYAYGDN